MARPTSYAQEVAEVWALPQEFESAWMRTRIGFATVAARSDQALPAHVRAPARREKTRTVRPRRGTKRKVALSEFACVFVCPPSSYSAALVRAAACVTDVVYSAFVAFCQD